MFLVTKQLDWYDTPLSQHACILIVIVQWMNRIVSMKHMNHCPTIEEYKQEQNVGSSMEMNDILNSLIWVWWNVIFMEYRVIKVANHSAVIHYLHIHNNSDNQSSFQWLLTTQHTMVVSLDMLYLQSTYNNKYTVIFKYGIESYFHELLTVYYKNWSLCQYHSCIYYIKTT